jgi:GPH family glycoside/pentoside/hexuronide:cation symporter
VTEAGTQKRAVTAPIKLAYGMGQLVEGVSTAVVGNFSFYLYTAVLGLSGSMVGVAAAISLVADALVDPLIGSVSDNSRSRWGRRIPFMMIGAPLVALGLGLAFSPPARASPILLFAWLVAVGLGLRFCVSLFNVPFIALGAEVSEDYAERAGIVAYRLFFGILGSFIAITLGYSVFFAGPGGLLRLGGYAPFGWTTAALVFIGGAVSVIGMRRFASELLVAPPTRVALHRRFAGEVAEIFRNPSFRVLFASTVLFYVAQGVAGTLGLHLNTFVWRMTAAQIQITVYGLFAGLVVGIPLAPLIVRRLEKRTVLMVGLLALCLAQGGLSGLRALGLFNLTGAAVVGPLTLNAFFAGIGITFATIAVGSMMADAADEHDYLFGARREGLYFSGLGFAGKAATGLGALVAGLALDVIRFPKGVAGQGPTVTIPADTLTGLATVAGPLAALVSAVATLLLIFYRIDRKRHEEVVAILHARRQGGDPGPAGSEV